jgi:hypothetical protein
VGDGAGTSKNFEKLTRGLHELGRVESGNIDSQNVTEEFVDLEARLKTAKLEAERWTELLEREADMEDIIKVQQQLVAVQQRIEQIQGRMRYLTDQVSLSTITATFHEETLGDLPEPEEFDPLWHIKNGLVTGKNWGQALLIAVMYLIMPGVFVWGPVVILILLVRARLRRERQQRAEASKGKPAPPPAPPGDGE